MTHYTIQYAPLAGRITAPPSKSQTMRAIVFATMAHGTSVLSNTLSSPDTEAMLTACAQLGAHIERDGTTLYITGVAGHPQTPKTTIDAGNSGQVLRFIAGLAALCEGNTTLTGDASIRQRRPMAPLLQAMQQLGGHATSHRNNGYAPVTIQGPIRPGTATLSGLHAQPVSAILMACAFLNAPSNIQVTDAQEIPWVAMTLDWFDRLNIAYTRNGFASFQMHGSAKVHAFEYTVPGDFSSMAFPLVASIITRSHITIDGLNMQDAQGDKQIIRVLQCMGTCIETTQDAVHVQPCTQPLQGIAIDMNDIIDALPILAVAACHANGATQLYNASAARQKESDRLRTITQELQKMGANIIEEHDALVITGNKLHAATVDSHHDHRIAMALSVAAMSIEAPSTITQVACIDKSYPDFYNAMHRLGASITRFQTTP